MTSLCEDVYGLVNVHIQTLWEWYKENDEAETDDDNNLAIVQSAAGAILNHLHELQYQSRDLFLVDVESCCAAANDLIRLGDTLRGRKRSLKSHIRWKIWQDYC